MTHDKKRLLSIGEAAKALEVTRRMILNYEDKGAYSAGSERRYQWKPLLYSRHRLAHPEHPHSAESRSLAG